MLRVSLLMFAVACGRYGFDPLPEAACPAEATCEPAAACWTGTCASDGVCLPTAPIMGTCVAGTCVAPGICEGSARPGPASTTPGELFGMGIDRQEDRLIVGSPGTGVARIFEQQSDGSWTEAALLTSPIGGPNRGFGLAVSLDGDRALVGAHAYGAGGAAAVFERQSDGTWLEVALLEVAGTASFGTALDLDGDRALIGDESTFTAHMFERQGNGTWTVAATLGPYDNDFGKNVVLVGDRAFVSATWEPNEGQECGSVRVFDRSGDGAWNLTAFLQPPPSEMVHVFGVGMAVDGDVLAVGGPLASREAPSSGVVIVYRRDGTGTWQFEAALHETAPVSGGTLGQGVAVQGDRIVASMVRTDDGIVAVFRRQPDGQWLQVARLVDPLGEMAGYGVGGVASDLQMRIVGDEVVTGAPKRGLTDNFSGGLVFYDLTGL